MTDEDIQRLYTTQQRQIDYLKEELIKVRDAQISVQNWVRKHKFPSDCWFGNCMHMDLREMIQRGIG